jgi:hypothetical protein
VVIIVVVVVMVMVRNLFYVDVFVSCQYLLYVFYPVMAVCLYAALKLTSCTRHNLQ